MTKTAIILAGGLGTRLRSVVSDVPKPMAPIAGRPFLEWQMDAWIQQGIHRFILSVGYRHEAISGHFGDRYRDTCITYMVEETPLGTGGGVLLALDACAQEESVLLLNGDTWFAVGLAELDAFAESHQADWCFSLFPANQENRYGGMDVAEDGRIRSLRTGAARLGQAANGGVYRIRPASVRALGLARGVPLSLEDTVVAAALSAGQRVYGMQARGAFLDIGIPADYLRAETLITGLGG